MTAIPAFGSEGGVAPKAVPLFEVFGLPITNSLVTSWVVSLFILLVIRLMVGKATLVPGRGQAIIESALSALKDLITPIIGKKTVNAAYPLILGLFFYILLQNWSGLLPGVGTMGFGLTDAAGKFHLMEPIIRPANADWNGTIALAIVAMTAWFIIVLNPKYGGIKLLAYDLFGNKADKKELAVWMYYILSGIFAVVGLIEVFSICIRPFTLSVRLFGNVFGGENLLHQTGFVFPFYFLELIVGFVQALVFILLLSVYIGLICNHGDDHEDEHGEAAAH
ncbi:MAG: F0F1 ATP synthase subunit A [Verrucomicrobiota bacterium]|nr:F0F1 ATP synthase subunit A [Verrucomicrobiota bacterium]